MNKKEGKIYKMDKNNEKKEKITINIASENFKNALINLINESQLPISNVYYIFKYLEKEVENTYYGTLNSEAPITEVVEELPGTKIKDIEEENID